MTKTDLIPSPKNPPSSIFASTSVPRLIAAAGTTAHKSYIEYFTAHIRNKNTRAAYHHAVRSFFLWCDEKGMGDLSRIEPIHVAAYIEWLQRAAAAPTVKQHLAAIRMLFDWLVVRQVMRGNPASSVRGPKHVVKKGKTPILSPEEARELFAHIRTDTVVGLRDRALIGVLIYSFARISAALAMRVEDYYPQGKRWWLRLHEKGGKRHDIPAHHTLEEYLDAYITAAGIGDDMKGPLFRSAIRKTGVLTDRPLVRQNAFDMVQRRARDAGILTRLGCHSFRGTGITIYLENGGELETAQMMAAHESPRTADQITLDEVEKISF